MAFWTAMIVATPGNAPTPKATRASSRSESDPGCTSTMPKPATSERGRRLGRTASAAPHASPASIGATNPRRSLARQARTSAASHKAVAGTSFIGCTTW
jgi:hypothetical protein